MLRNWTYKDGQFDLVTSTEVFEHFPDDMKGFREIYRVLKKGGYFVFTVPLSNADATVERAYIKDNDIVYVLPPIYHGDRTRGSRKVLTFYMRLLRQKLLFVKKFERFKIFTKTVQYMNLPVSIVIPMYNAERHIKEVLEAILSQDYSAPVEIIVVNDGSKDKSLEIVKSCQSSSLPLLTKRGIKIIDQPNQGAVAATNNGYNAASHDIICSIDSDVVLSKTWLKKIVEEFDDKAVGAVQGYYKTPRGVSFWAKIMGYDVEARYDSIHGNYVSQVCTGNTAYRRSAIEKVGLFDPIFTYGYDNDMSYRLQEAGYKLVFRKDAVCDHYWKTDFKGYIKQQYYSAYGRMQLIQKHRTRILGDSVSGPRMILQVPLTLLSFILLIGGVMVSRPLFFAALGLMGITLFDRISFAFNIFKKQKDLTVFLLPPVHIIRNIVWCWALVWWSFRLLMRY